MRNPINVKNILETVAEVRNEGCETPIILFSYFNPILQFGLNKFVEKAVEAGVDGILVTDLVPEEAEEFRADFSRKKIVFDNARRANFER